MPGESDREKILLDDYFSSLNTARGATTQKLVKAFNDLQKGDVNEMVNSSPLPAGIKNDKGKDRWDLLPIGPVREIVKVLTFGAEKYSPDNWKYVDNHKARYFAAMQRHITSWWEDDEMFDPETGIHHLAHAGCCMLFAIWHDMNPGKK